MKVNFSRLFVLLQASISKSIDYNSFIACSNYQIISEIIRIIFFQFFEQCHMRLFFSFLEPFLGPTRSFSFNGFITLKGPEHTGHFVQPHVAAHCGGDIYSRRKPLFSSFGEHTAVCGPSVRQAVARPRHRQSVCIHNIRVAATCRPSVLGSATMRGHMWLNKVASVLGSKSTKVGKAFS